MGVFASLSAPADGTISAVHVKTVGAVVQAGTVLAEIVPDEQHLLVEARILSEDIGSIYTGQLAQVSLSAYDVSRYGNLEGHVQRIAQNTTQEQDAPPLLSDHDCHSRTEIVKKQDDGRDCARYDGDGRHYRPEAHRFELHHDAA